MTLYLLIGLAGLHLGVLLGVFGVALCVAAKRVNEYLPPNPLQTPAVSFPSQQPQ